MNQYLAGLLVAFAAFYFPTFGLYHFMVFKVNRQLPPASRIPHSLYFGEWNRLAKEYKGFYPKSFLYQLTLSYAVTLLVLAVAVFFFRFWEYATGR